MSYHLAEIKGKLKLTRGECGYLITAFNPMDEILPLYKNKLRQLRLKKILKNSTSYQVGNNYHFEEMLLTHNQIIAIRLMELFNQRAIFKVTMLNNTINKQIIGSKYGISGDGE